LIGDGKGFRVVAILPPQGEETAPAQVKSLLNLDPAHQAFSVGPKEKGYLLAREAPVKLHHGSLLRR
jgi:hypothetical protein